MDLDKEKSAPEARLCLDASKDAFPARKDAVDLQVSFLRYEYGPGSVRKMSVAHVSRGERVMRRAGPYLVVQPEEKQACDGVVPQTETYELF